MRTLEGTLSTTPFRWLISPCSFCSGLLYLFCVPFGPLLGRFPRYRLHMQAFGVACGAVGLIGSAFATHPSHILLCLGIIFPFSCVFYMGAIPLVFEWFQERRGTSSPTGLVHLRIALR